MIGKRGRPAKNEAKKNQYRIRMTDEDASALEYLSEKLGLSKADVIRKGLKILLNLSKYSD